MQKHILFVLDYFLPHRGGAENVFENIIKRLVNRGYKITVLTSRFDENLKKHEKTILDGTKQKIDIYRSGKTRLGFLFKGVFTGVEILRNTQQNIPDISVIHTSTYGGALPAWLLGKFFKKKVILTIHEVFGKLRYFYKGKIIGFLFLLFERLIFAVNYDQYHCVSRYTMNSLRLMYGVGDKKLQTIYNGIDTEFRNIDNIDRKIITNFKHEYKLNNKLTCLYYGHSGKSKGLDYLIEAIPDIINSNKNIDMVFNLIHSKRDKYCKNKIYEQTKKLEKNQESRIKIFNGMPIKKLHKLVACSDIVIAPSISEGFGSVHTEATAMGKILITTEIGPLPEVLSGKVVFIRPQDPKAIVKAVGTACNGNIKRIPKKDFSWDVCVDKIEEVYFSVCPTS